MPFIYHSKLPALSFVESLKLILDSSVIECCVVIVFGYALWGNAHKLLFVVAACFAQETLFLPESLELYFVFQ